MKYSLLYLSQTNSTNTFCLENINSLEDNTVVWATHQTMGKGQRSNQWYSTPQKSLCFSLIIKNKELTSTNIPAVIKSASQSIITTFSPIIDNLKIKEPNDIYVGDCKLAGLLCETHLIGEKVNAFILGIGININQNEQEISSWQLPYPATSLLLSQNKQDNKPFIIKEVLNSLLLRFKNEKLN